MARRVIHGVIFDWNGTLLNDAKTFYVHGLIPALEARGVDMRQYASAEGYEQLRFQFSMLGPTKYVRMVAMQHGLEIDWSADIQPALKDYLRDKRSRLANGSKHVLEQLRASHVPLALVSGMASDPFEVDVTSRSLERYFRMRRGGISHKTASVRSFISRVGCDPHRILCVSDIQKDLQEFLKAGCFTVGYTGGYGNVESLLEAEPHEIIHNIGELLDLAEFRPVDWS